jgi:hypothetical protein
VLQIVLCKFLDHADESLKGSLDLRGPPQDYIIKWYRDRNLLPDNPANFSSQPGLLGRLTSSPRVRVLIEQRNGTVRTFLNLQQLLGGCNSDTGPWECRAFSLGSNFVRSAEALEERHSMYCAAVMCRTHVLHLSYCIPAVPPCVRGRGISRALAKCTLTQYVTSSPFTHIEDK